MKKCKKCGRPLGKSGYCSVCDKKQILADRERNKKFEKRKGILVGGFIALFFIAIIVAIFLTRCESTESETETLPEVTSAPVASTPETDISGKHHVEIEIADYGTIALELDADAAPITVENFIRLANEGFYDGLTFHRIMEGFMMQGGDPEGNGTGGSDREIKGEFSANGVQNSLSHTRGAISMARNNLSMDSASSQFFIVHQDSLFLDGQYACFGYVTSGMEIVDAVCAAAKPVDDNGTILPDEQPVITAVRVID